MCFCLKSMFFKEIKEILLFWSGSWLKLTVFAFSLEFHMPHRQPSSSPDQAVGRPLSSWAGGCSWQCVELEKVRIPNVIRGCWPSSTVCVQQGGFVSKNFLLFGFDNLWEKVPRSPPEFPGVGRRDMCRITGYGVLGVLRFAFATKTNRIVVLFCSFCWFWKVLNAFCWFYCFYCSFHDLKGFAA